MSKKINVLKIISEHFFTLEHDETKRILFIDILVFCLLPIALAIVSIFINLDLNKDFVGAAINFGAIFSALLMSVLMLVYDQESKVQERIKANKDLKISVDLLELKRDLLKQLYHNICFTVICSVFIVLVCLIKSALPDSLSFVDRFILTPLVIMLVYSITITCLLVIKRMHSLLHNSD